MIVVFTAETILENEAESLNALFEVGLQILHLRKPKSCKKQYEQLLKAINPNYHSRIMLHQFHDLAAIYGCKGIHLKGIHKNQFTKEKDGLKKYIESYQNKGFCVSTGVHSLTELKKYQSSTLDYVFLSPIFNSISKKNYNALKLDHKTFKNIFSKFPVWALGGVDLEKIEYVYQMGFKGAAVLGAIWKTNEPTSYFKKLLDLDKKLILKY